MKFHGVTMAGPSKELKHAGCKGRWKGNIQRDAFRKISDAVLWHMNYLVYILI
jgi:hypothetical protein